MKKRFVLLIGFLLLFSVSCDTFTTRKFLVENNSNYRVVISITDLNELGDKVDKSFYVILAKDDVYDEKQQGLNKVFLMFIKTVNQHSLV